MRNGVTMDIVRVIPVSKSELLLYNKRCGRGGSDVIILDRKHLDAMSELSKDIPLREIPFTNQTETLTITKDDNGKYVVKDNENLGLLDSTEEYTTLYLTYKHNMFGFIRLEDDDIECYYGAHNFHISSIGGEYMVNTGSNYISLFSLIYYIIGKNDTYNRYGMFTNGIRADEILYGNILVFDYFNAYSELCNRYQQLNAKKEYKYCIGGKYNFKLKSLNVLCNKTGQEECSELRNNACETYIDDSMNNILFVSERIDDCAPSISKCIKDCMSILSYRDYWHIKDALKDGNKIVGININGNNEYKYIIDNFNKEQSNFNEVDILSRLTETSDC